MNKAHKYLLIDTETCNDLDFPFVYDFGASVIDAHGNVYEECNFINADMFCGQRELMKSAYYANKIPQYLEMIAAKEISMQSWYEIKEWVRRKCAEYDVKAIIAHNARFDYRACSTTQRYETCSKYRYFFPYGVEIWDTLKMAQDTICKQKRYIKFCTDNGYVCKNGKPRATAEILYRYISKDTEFEEAHKALDDVRIEREIFWRCMRQHKKMTRKCFNN